MKALKHVSGQPFVVIVGIAALIHSAWTVSTFSGGEGPQVHTNEWPAFFLSALAWLWWLLPGFLAAFALEVGQVVTARQIQAGVGRRVKVARWSINVKILTFVILSAATYLLQLTYLLHHYPNLPISAGLSVQSRQAAGAVMEIVVWCMPLLLPAAMLMFTASDEISQRQPYPLQTLAGPIQAQCPQCKWCNEYPDTLSAQNALNGHMRAHILQPEASSNGKH